jgi:hypothetical protein
MSSIALVIEIYGNERSCGTNGNLR